MSKPIDLTQLSADQLRTLTTELMASLAAKEQLLNHKDRVIVHRDAVIEKLSHELATLKRHKYTQRSEQMNALQASLLDELVEGDLAAIEIELAELTVVDAPAQAKKQPKRAPLPAELPRTLIHHEPENTLCNCGCQLKRVGEDVSEKLDYVPGEFTVERHIRGKWACAQCETLIQAPIPAQVIDKGIPTAGLLAQVLVAKYSDHLPLYRQERIFARAGFAIPRSTLAEWVGACGLHLQPLVDALRSTLLEHSVLHADETPVSMLAPGKKKTHKAYVWAYCTTPFSDLKAVVYNFAPTRAGEHARNFLGDWQGKLVCDDYSGYKAGFGNGITEIGCMAHARRKFYDLHQANQSTLAAQALEYISQLYMVEREVKDLPPDKRQATRHEKARPIVDALHQWMLIHRQKVPDGSGTARALDYSLKRWTALTRYLDDGAVPIDNNWVENQIRPWALGRSNWLFAGSLRSGQRAAAVMTLIQSAKLNGHDPYAYLKDVLTRLPTQKNNTIDALLPHNWKPTIVSKV